MQDAQIRLDSPNRTQGMCVKSNPHSVVYMVLLDKFVQLCTVLLVFVIAEGEKNFLELQPRFTQITAAQLINLKCLNILSM